MASASREDVEVNEKKSNPFYDALISLMKEEEEYESD
jgi:hypothetical protein